MCKTDRYRLTPQDCDLIALASSMHDIGKIAIDAKILNKPGKLTPEEFEQMKQHTILGAKMLDDLAAHHNEKLVGTACDICRWHHERYDGHGYPDGLVGDEIPISAQVVSLADVYDALISERVYKPAYSHEQAMTMILNGECGVFNPLLIECLKELRETLRCELDVPLLNVKREKHRATAQNLRNPKHKRRPGCRQYRRSGRFLPLVNVYAVFFVAAGAHCAHVDILRWIAEREYRVGYNRLRQLENRRLTLHALFVRPSAEPDRSDAEVVRR